MVWQQAFLIVMTLIGLSASAFNVYIGRLRLRLFLVALVMNIIYIAILLSIPVST